MDIREALSQAIDKVEKEDEPTVGSTTPPETNVPETSGDSGGAADQTPQSKSADGDTSSGDRQVSAEAGSGDKSTDGAAGKDDSNIVDAAAGSTSGDAAKDGGRTEAKDAATDKPGNDEQDGSGPRFRVDRAPQAWKGEVREKWNDLPLNIRQEIVRRERAFDSAMRESASARDFAGKFQQLVEPHKNQFPGGNIIQGIKSLLDADRVLSSSDPKVRARALAELVTSYNVDINALDEALAANPLATAKDNPIVAAVRSELDRRLPRNPPPQQYAPQQQVVDNGSLEAELVAMAKNTKDFEFFFDVVDDMADIMELSARRGVALTPQQAYTRAVNSNPEISGIVREREAEKLKRETAEKLTQQAQAAKKAAVSVSGAALGKPTTQISGDPSNLRSTISSAMDQLANGSGRI